MGRGEASSIPCNSKGSITGHGFHWGMDDVASVASEHSLATHHAPRGDEGPACERSGVESACWNAYFDHGLEASFEAMEAFARSPLVG